MPATKRQLEPSVMRRLLAEPWRYQLVQAVRILLRWLAQNGVPHEEALTQVLRFQNSLSLGFPPSEIEALRIETDGAASLTALLALLRQRAPARVCLTPAFIGLLGASGTLPFHHTERIALQAGDREAGARAFLDMYSNRMVALFCQAWGKYRLEYKLDTQGEDGELPLLMALGGVRAGTFSLPSMRRVMPEVAGHYAGLLRMRPTSAAVVGRVLSEYFGVPVTLQPFVGAWHYIAERQRSKLSPGRPRLGAGATLGVRIWRHDLQMRLHIGPLDKPGMQRFLPRGEAAAALAGMLALFAAPDLDYEVRLALSVSCVQPFVLSTRLPEAQSQLGWNTFLALGGADKVLRPEVAYMLHLKPAPTPRFA